MLKNHFDLFEGVFVLGVEFTIFTQKFLVKLTNNYKETSKKNLNVKFAFRKNELFFLWHFCSTGKICMQVWDGMRVNKLEYVNYIWVNNFSLLVWRSEFFQVFFLWKCLWNNAMPMHSNAHSEDQSWGVSWLFCSYRGIFLPLQPVTLCVGTCVTANQACFIGLASQSSMLSVGGSKAAPVAQGSDSDVMYPIKHSCFVYRSFVLL